MNRLFYTAAILLALASPALADDTRWTTSERYVQSDAVFSCVNRWNARPDLDDPAKQDEVDASAGPRLQRCQAAAKAMTKQQAAEVLIEREKAAECYRLAGRTPNGPDCAKMRAEEKVLKRILGQDQEKDECLASRYGMSCDGPMIKD